MDINIIKKALKEFTVYSEKVSKEFGKSSLYWKFDMAWCLLKYGARPVDFHRFNFYTLNRFERNKYLTFRRYQKIAKQLIKSGIIFADKVREYERYADYIHRKWIPTKNKDKSEISEFINKYSPCIAKPNSGEQGRGIFVVNKLNVTPEIIETLVTQDYLLEQKLSNCKELAEINNSSLNTVRVFTLVDKAGKIHILDIKLRVGSNGSEVDNWGAGGVGYEIDKENGVITSAGIDKKKNIHIKHPGTDKIMPGFEIPRFKELKKTVLAMCELDKSARLVGWDIAITDNGLDLIEMNCPGGHDILQCHGEPFYDRIIKDW